jgi:hypothetical protein
MQICTLQPVEEQQELSPPTARRFRVPPNASRKEQHIIQPKIIDPIVLRKSFNNSLVFVKVIQPEFEETESRRYPKRYYWYVNEEKHPMFITNGTTSSSLSSQISLGQMDTIGKYFSSIDPKTEPMDLSPASKHLNPLNPFPLMLIHQRGKPPTHLAEQVRFVQDYSIYIIVTLW